jgi:hypothetical protein
MSQLPVGGPLAAGAECYADDGFGGRNAARAIPPAVASE